MPFFQGEGKQALIKNLQSSMKHTQKGDQQLCVMAHREMLQGVQFLQSTDVNSHLVWSLSLQCETHIATKNPLGACGQAFTGYLH